MILAIPGLTHSMAVQPQRGERRAAFAVEHSAWPARKLDAQTTYGALHGPKGVAAGGADGYCKQRTKHFDATDYGLHGEPTSKARIAAHALSQC